MKFLSLVCGLILAAILAGCSTASSQTLSAALSWVAPTTYTNGAAIPAGTVITYNVYQGATGAETLLSSGVSALTFSATTGLTSGSTVCWEVTAVIAGVESSRSNEACKTFPSVPSPPASLTVK